MHFIAHIKIILENYWLYAVLIPLIIDYVSFLVFYLRLFTKQANYTNHVKIKKIEQFQIIKNNWFFFFWLIIKY